MFIGMFLAFISFCMGEKQIGKNGVIASVLSLCVGAFIIVLTIIAIGNL
jgi:hypothetical protein